MTKNLCIITLLCAIQFTNNTAFARFVIWCERLSGYVDNKTKQLSKHGQCFVENTNKDNCDQHVESISCKQTHLSLVSVKHWEHQFEGSTLWPKRMARARNRNLQITIHVGWQRQDMHTEWCYQPNIKIHMWKLMICCCALVLVP